MGCLPRLSKFLCCLSLQAGGYICGIFTAIVAGFALAGSLTELFTGLTKEQTAGWWTVMILNIIYLVLLLYASVMLVIGTKNSNPNNMRLYLIFMVLGIIVAFLQIFVTHWLAVFLAILWTIIVIYFFICIYSLFQETGGKSILC